jgi:hypothetical protein
MQSIAMCDISIHQNGMIAGNSNILKSGKYSDLIICCGDHEFKVHRAIVCPRSNFSLPHVMESFW